MYHLEKRSASNPPKKAFASLEKKVTLKEGLAAHIEKLKSDLKNVTEENSTMPYNATVANESTNQTILQSDLHNASVTSVQVSSPNSTLASTTTVSSNTDTSTKPSIIVPQNISSTASTVSSTPSSNVTTFDDILPTKPSNITNTTVSIIVS